MSSLPRTNRQPTPRPPPHTRLSPLIQRQNGQPKRRRQEEMLRGNIRRLQHALQLRDVEPEDGHGEREEDGGEEEEVVGSFVEGWWVGEDAETAGAHGHDV